MTYRLVEFEIVHPHPDFVCANTETGYKQIANIFEHESREKLLRYARKAGVKIRGNSLVEITEVLDN